MNGSDFSIGVGELMGNDLTSHLIIDHKIDKY